MQSCLGPKMPISRLATESRPSQAQCSSWQLPLNGRAVPALPCAGGLPPQRPPLVIPPCLRDSSSPPTRQSCRRPPACAAPAVRITNHESRITPVLYHRVCAIPARRRRASRVDAPLPARFQLAADAPVMSTPPCVRGTRSSNHESRLCYTTVPARPQPVAVAPRTRSHRTRASPTCSQFDPRPPLPPGTGH